MANRTDRRNNKEEKSVNTEKSKGKGEIISEMGISTQVLLRATSKEQKPKLRLQIQTAQGRRTDLQTSVTNSTEVKTKSEITEDMGLSHRQTVEYQQMAQNPEAVQAAIQKAKKEAPRASNSEGFSAIFSF